MAAATRRRLVLVVAALVVGSGIGLLDSRPTWDDTGVTVALLVLAGAIFAAVDGRHPWGWALLVGAPLAIIEVPASGSLAPLAGVAFAAVGAAGGWLLARTIGGHVASSEEGSRWRI
ncbi:MAG TPA: hypothetical protein VGI98_07415 [Candidatus Limnocylindrales bacterium]|jgi:hypothetical protein